MGYLVRLSACLLACALSGGVAFAESEAKWAYELSDELMSPYCPGRALSECPSGNADAMRRWIIEQEEAGVSRAEVEEALYARFGDQLRQAPRAEGVGIVAYAVPAVALLVGGVVLVMLLTRRRASDDSALPPEDPELARELDEELRA